MSTDDAIRILDVVRPELAVMTHLGMSMLRQGPEKEAEKIQEVTGVRTIAAVDGMVLLFGASIGVQAQRKPDSSNLTNFM